MVEVSDLARGKCRLPEEDLREGAAEIDRLVSLLCRHEDLSSDPRHTHKKLGAVPGRRRQEALQTSLAASKANSSGKRNVQ